MNYIEGLGFIGWVRTDRALTWGLMPYICPVHVCIYIYIIHVFFFFYIYSTYLYTYIYIYVYCRVEVLGFAHLLKDAHAFKPST